MVNTLSGSVSAYRNEQINKRYIRIEEVMSMLNVSKEESLEIALAAGARYKLSKIALTPIAYAIRRLCPTLRSVTELHCNNDACKL